jgi:hypothetical protein
MAKQSRVLVHHPVEGPVEALGAGNLDVGANDYKLSWKNFVNLSNGMRFTRS